MKVNIAVVGPPKTGKSAIANHLADLSETLEIGEYHPTRGLRILEFERDVQILGGSSKVQVQLYDISGNNAYVDAWKYFSNDFDGVLYVISSDSKDDRDLDEWQKVVPNVGADQVAIFAHKTGTTGKRGRFKINNKLLSKAQLQFTSLDEDPDQIKQEFDALVANVATTKV